MGIREADADLANVKIQTTVENAGAEEADCKVVSEILGPDGKSVRTISTTHHVSAGGSAQIEQEAAVNHPQLWSVDSPRVYTLRTTVMQNGDAVDSTTTTFGIRTIRV